MRRKGNALLREWPTRVLPVRQEEEGARKEEEGDEKDKEEKVGVRRMSDEGMGDINLR